jgi:ferredoxin
MPRVEVEGFPPFDVDPETTLLQACELQGIPMESACGGFAACNSCRVVVIGSADGLSPEVDEEDTFLDRADQRLGCQARVLGPVRVRLDPGM